jgi:quercetin dioxygenase-like cupin family protein
MLRASTVDTGGSFELIEYEGPLQPPPHIHQEHDEAFYVLGGTFTFVLGTDEVEAPEGALVVIPRGTRHGFSAEAGSRALLLVVPGGLEGFFAELGEGIAAGRSSAEMREALAGRYDSLPA